MTQREFRTVREFEEAHEQAILDSMAEERYRDREEEDYYRQMAEEQDKAMRQAYYEAHPEERPDERQV